MDDHKVSRKTSHESRMTLYRLTGLRNLKDAIREKYLESEGFTEQSVTVGDRAALLITGKTDEKDPGWSKVLAGISGKPVVLKNSVAAAALIIEDSRGPEPSTTDPHAHVGSDENLELTAWALTFGMGFQLLDQRHVDNGFGQRIAVRCADPLGLNSISKTTLDERPRIERSTIPSGAPLRSFGFQDLGDLATRLVVDGRVDGIGTTTRAVKIRGADALSLPLSKEADRLIRDLDQVKAALAKKPATEELAALEQLAQVKDKDKIAELDAKLMEAIGADDSPLLTLSFPHELIDEYGSVGAYKLLGTRERKARDYLPTLQDILEPVREVVGVERLQKLDRLAVLLFENADDDAPSSPKIPAKKWLAFQTELEERRFFLHNGRWFLMDRAYAEVVKRRTRAIFDRGPYLSELPDWELVEVPGDEKEQKKRNAELSYNQKLAQSLGGLCLDQKLVRSEIHKHGIEACDVLLNDGTFIHVKHVDASSPASHLLAQALVSTEVLTYDKTAQSNLAARISEQGGAPEEFQLKPSRVVIVMAREGKLLDADSLFTFTQVNLSRQVAQLEQQHVDVFIAPILRTRQLVSKE
ncbi:DUF6119 family protein [Arthrobacter glacialis]|uniref:DUF6119 family protein n=1 Tax=Arthrobacter glacialis TaxID=1664 RepID=UPI000CD44FE7|nr:DUF6119 family protein [Arthrobacter glacialis]POH60291.1 hypothetical protein CVS28_05010 [Arthrobacter glacialis]